MMNLFSRRFRIILSALVLILFTNGVSFAETWESEVLSVVTLQNLTSVWTTSSITPPDTITTEIFCVGKSGTIIYNDGSGWVSQASGTSFDLNGIWGTSPDNVFAVGDNELILHYNGTAWASSHSIGLDLNAVWGSSASNIFAVGDSGTILHYNGSTWSEQTSGTNNNLNAVWGSSGSDVFVVGDLFTILHYDGSTWSQFEATTQNITLNGIWGYAANSVFAVGEAGTIIWYNGEVWSLLSSEISTSIILNSVWGASACNIYAVGRVSGSGTIYHFDGSTWSSQAGLIDPANPSPLLGMHGTSMRDIFAVGNGGTFAEYVLEPDEDDPLICATSPVDGATNTAIDTDIMALFSTEMDPATITQATFTLTDGSSPVTGTVSYESGAFAVFTPDADLDYETSYTATLSTDIEDRFGYGIGYAADYTWSFTTSEESSSSSGGGCFIIAARSR